MGEKHRQSGATRSATLQRLSGAAVDVPMPQRPATGTTYIEGPSGGEWQELHQFAAQRLTEAGVASRMVATRWELISLLTSQLYALRIGALVGDFSGLFPNDPLFPVLRRQLPAALPLVEAALATAQEQAELPVGITLAAGLIAQTGTLVLEAESAAELSASLLPRQHWVVVPLDRVFADVRQWYLGTGGMQKKNYVFVSGPSRTADIEKTLVWGVHGPWSVSVVFFRTDQAGRE